MHGRDHLPRGADPIPGIPDPSGSDLEDLILATNPDAFWKLDETTGDIAHDSSGNEHDLTADPDPPTWGQPAGPPGTTTAEWVDDTTRVTGALDAFTDNFTAGLWVNILALPPFADELIGQGEPAHSAGAGWNIVAFPDGSDFKFATWVGSGQALANNILDIDTWYFVATVRASGTWKLYINGLLQADTITDSPGTSYGGNTWLGNDGYPSHTSYARDVRLSYAFITNAVLTSTDLLAMYQAGTGGGAPAEGFVWMSDGAGGSSWQPVVNSLNELTGDITLSEGANITLTQAGQDIEIASTGGGFDPATATSWWFPLFDSDGTAVLDGDGDLIPTLIPL